MALIQILTGSALSDRSEQIDQYLIENIRDCRLLVPTREYARQRTHRLVQNGTISGFLGRPILTFQDFVSGLLHNTAYEQELIDDGAQRVLLEGIVARMERDGLLDSIGPAATTPGFVSHLHRTIAQLKQCAIPPDEFATRTDRPDRDHAIDRIVAHAYAQYQEALKAAAAYDQQGMYWMADLACRDRPPKSISHLNMLVLDGFDDFTESEFRLVRTLAQHLQRVLFGLVVDMDRSPEDQGRLVRRTFSLIESSFEDGEPLIADGREPETRIEYASLHLFGQPDQPPDAALKDNIRLVECYNPRHESEWIAAEIKRAVRNGQTEPHRVAVVHADASSAAPRFRMAFRDYGIPLNARGGSPLDMSGLGAFVLSLLGAIETWSRREVLSIVASPYAGADPLDAFEALAIEAGVVKGRTQWRSRIQRLMAAQDHFDTELEQPLDHIPDVHRTCASLLEQITKLEGMADAFPVPCDAAKLAHWIGDALDTFEVAAAVHAFNEDTAGAATQELEALNQALRRLTRWYGKAHLDRPKVARVLRQCLHNVEVSFDRNPNGVWYGRPEDIRHLTFDLVFCAGLTEGVFPARPTGNAIYGERERADLAKLGIHLRDAEWYAHRQTGLFQRIFDCASDTLILTWPVTNSTGDPAMASPFIEDLDLLFGSRTAEKFGTPAKAVLADCDRCGSARDARNRILDAAVYADGVALPGLDSARAGADVESARYDSRPFDAFDGVISDPVALASIQERFGNKHCFSATELQTYLSCPFRFFLERVLNVESSDEPDDGFDPKLRGLVLHSALETLYQRRRGQRLDTAIEKVVEDLEAAIEAAFNRWSWKTSQIVPAIVTIEKNRLRRRLRRFVRWSAVEPGNDGWIPSHLEVQFGTHLKPGADPVSTATPFRFETVAGPILVQGKIDRIDCRDHEVRLIDYKSGGVPTLARLKDGSEIQLPLYAAAVKEQLMPDCSVAGALYWSPGRTAASDGRRDAFSGQQWTADDALAMVSESVGSSVAGMRAGHFALTAAEKRCNYCPNGKVCRFEEGRVERKCE